MVEIFSDRIEINNPGVIIGETISAGLIKSHDPENRSRKHAKYVPYWA